MPGLLFNYDEQVAAYIFGIYKQRPMKYDSAIGILDKEQKLIGGVLFQNWNGFNVELSYYGQKTVTPGIVKCLARYLITRFDVSRITVSTSKRNKRILRALQNFGFGIEGAQRRFYGSRDINRNTAIRCVMFRERIEKLAKLEDKVCHVDVPNHA